MSIKTQIESLLFISNKPLTIKTLAKLVKSDVNKVKDLVEEIMNEYNQDNRGIWLMKIEDKVQLATNPDNSNLIEEYIKEEFSGELTRPSLETLTIIAYRGPISKPELEMIRGVNCGLILRNLMMRGLIEAKENKKTGEPIYLITFEFLRFLGINNVSALPDYEKLNSSEVIEKLIQSTKK